MQDVTYNRFDKRMRKMLTKANNSLMMSPVSASHCSTVLCLMLYIKENLSI